MILVDSNIVVKAVNDLKFLSFISLNHNRGFVENKKARVAPLFVAGAGLEPTTFGL